MNGPGDVGGWLPAVKGLPFQVKYGDRFHPFLAIRYMSEQAFIFACCDPAKCAPA